MLNYLFIILLLFQQDATPINLRKALDKAQQNEQAANLMYTHLKDKQTYTEVTLAYYAAAEFAMYKHSYNPITKWKYYTSAQQHMERAVANQNTETIYLRFFIQSSLPSFMGYRGNLNDDKNYLFDHFPLEMDPELKLRIMAILASSKYCTQDERDFLQNEMMVTY